MKLLLRASFNRYTGYGNDGIDIARWLDKLGVDVIPWPAVTVLPGIPEDFAMLMTKTAPRTGGRNVYDATVTFLPPFDIRIAPDTASARPVGLPLKIAPLHYGWSMWELDKLAHRDMRGHGMGQRPWKRLTRMYAATEVSKEAFEFYDPATEYKVLPMGIDPSTFKVVPRKVDGPTKFFMVGELHQRKDPWLSIEAFRALKNEHGDDFDAELHLKTNVQGTIPEQIEGWVPGIYVHRGHWPYHELLAWYEDMTCYLGPSRGEGALKPPMEFMAMGGTAIATFWSGPTVWLNDEVGYPLRFRLRLQDANDVDSPREARASSAHLKELMWHVHTHREEVRDKGMLAATHIRTNHSWEKVVGELITDIEKDREAL